MLPPHYNAIDARAFLDREKGRTAWILACGPSLWSLDPVALQGDCIIAVNRSIWAQDRLGFPKADYWLFGDLGIAQECDITKYPETSKWSGVVPAAYLLGRGFEQTDHGKGDSFLLYQWDTRPMIFRNSPTLRSYNKIINNAIHLAWLLGCNPVHIRGLDFGPDEAGRNYWFDPPGKPDAEAALEVERCRRAYERDRRNVQTMISAVQASGIRVTSGKDQQVLEPLYSRQEV